MIEQQTRNVSKVIRSKYDVQAMMDLNQLLDVSITDHRGLISYKLRYIPTSQARSVCCVRVLCTDNDLMRPRILLVSDKAWRFGFFLFYRSQYNIGYYAIQQRMQIYITKEANIAHSKIKYLSYKIYVRMCSPEEFFLSVTSIILIFHSINTLDYRRSLSLLKPL